MQAIVSAAAAAAPTRVVSGNRASSHRHVVNAVTDAEKRHDMPMSLRAAAVAGLAALLISVDSPAALAATAKKAPVQSGQGETLELLLSQQKSGQNGAKSIKSKAVAAPVAAYRTGKPAAAPKPAASSKPAPKAAAAPKKAATVTTKAAVVKPLKFDTKATPVGVQGAAPAGIALPVPKNAAKMAAQTPVKTKSAAKPVAVKKAPTTTPKLVKKTAAAPAAAAAAAATKVTAAAATSAAAVTAVKVAVTSAPAAAAPVVKSSAAAAALPALGAGAMQAGGVIVAELVGLAVASSVVGQITSVKKA